MAPESEMLKQILFFFCPLQGNGFSVSSCFSGDSVCHMFGGGGRGEYGVFVFL